MENTFDALSARSVAPEPPNKVIGWREWVALPALGIPAIKAKVDTGARTSALHTFHTEIYRQNNRLFVRFLVHPIQRRTDVVVSCAGAVLDCRTISDSGGHRETRYVVETPLRMGEREWTIELTLTDRDSMLFRMLLGRTAMGGRLIVDPAASYLGGDKPNLRELYSMKGTKKKSTPQP